MTKKLVLNFSIFVVGLCSIVYELLIGTVSTYFIGDSVTQFSLVIGFYLAAIGLGSFCTKYLNKDLLLTFIKIEILLGDIGALSVPSMYAVHGMSDLVGFRLYVFVLIGLIGFLTGFEIPLVTRIAESYDSLKESISNIFGLDYAGALIATLLFPFVFLPFVGNFKTSLFIGALNLLIGLLNLEFFKKEIGFNRKNVLRGVLFCSLALIVALNLVANKYIYYWNNVKFRYPIIFEENSQYQNIKLSKSANELRLYLNDAIQFSSRDEYKYHEALVHVPLLHYKDSISVLVLGGGEGLVAREVLKYPKLSKLDIVDIDPAITVLAKTNPLLLDLNESALHDPRVNTFNQDAFVYLEQDTNFYDLIISDLPDPNSEAIARLYSRSFYELALQRLLPNGIFVTQATSPSLSPKAFLSIQSTLKECGVNNVVPYNVNVPSFGDWGFVLATDKEIITSYDGASVDSRLLNSSVYQSLFILPKELQEYSAEPNYLDKPVILKYYLDHWNELNNVQR